MNKTKKGIVVFLLAAALLVSMVGMASASQTWDLDHDDIMYKTPNAESGSRTITVSGSNLWIADQRTQGDFPFCNVNWDITLQRTNTDLDQQFTAEIGIWDGTSFVSKGNSGTMAFSGASDIADFFIWNVPAFTVPKDEYLAFRLNETSGANLVIRTVKGSSHVTCPRDIPTYPVPPPPPSIIDIYVDIKPESCPNAFNPKRGGVMSVAVLGTGDFDVTSIDLETIRLEGVVPRRWSYEDVATPFTGKLCDCHEEGADGYDDLVLKFKNQYLTDKLVLMNEAQNTDITLTLTGNLNDGTPFEGQDCIWINKAKK